MTMRTTLLRRLPAYEGKQIRVIENQTVPDIIDEILQAHKDYAKQYDTIAQLFADDDISTLCARLFELGKEIRYHVEHEDRQTVRSPAAILVMGQMDGADCKHYASLIGGILDAVSRQGKRINWVYRFCSYDFGSMIPEHVFIVVKHKGREIWIDPVLSELDQRYPFYYYNEDHRPMSLYRVYGVGAPQYDTTVQIVPDDYYNNYSECGTIGGDDNGGSPLDFLEDIAAVGKEIHEFFKKLFGGSKYSREVMWLTQQYQYYVLGQSDVTSRTKANEQYAPEAQAWFSTVLGVPIYDRIRLHALMGTNVADGAPLYNTDSARVNAYLAIGPDTQNIDPAAVKQAVNIAKQFKWSAPAGSWAQFAKAAPPVPGSGNGSENGSGDSTNGEGGFNLFKFIQANPIQSALIGAGIYFAIRSLRKR